MKIEFKVLNEKLKEYGIPAYATAGSAAIDLKALNDAPVTIRPGEIHPFDLGFAMDIGQEGVAAVIQPRSGLGSKGLVLANTVGLIDSDYQGSITCMALNRNRRSWRSCPFFKRFLPCLYKEPANIVVNPGDRIFQMYFLPVLQAEIVQTAAFSRSTARGEGGYGSTGVK